MPLGQFQPRPSGGKAGSFRPSENHGKPIIAVVREFREKFSSSRFPDPKPVVVYDVVDLYANVVHLSVISGSGPIVDQLKEYAGSGERLPIKIEKVNPPGGGNVYFTVVPLEGDELTMAGQWDQMFPTRIDDERARAQAEAQVQQNGAGGQPQWRGQPQPQPQWQPQPSAAQPQPSAAQPQPSAAQPQWQPQAPAAQPQPQPQWQPQQQAPAAQPQPQGQPQWQQQAPAAQPQWQQQAPAAPPQGQPAMSENELEQAIRDLG